ncbi:MAG: TspO/MBR family protein [Lysobacterales bacterium]
MHRSRWYLLPWALLPFLAAFGGAAFPPDAWFAALAKPSWQPPNWLFGPVWTALYLMMGVAAGLVWLRGPSTAVRLALTVFAVQLVLNALWTPVFFGARALGAALGVILLLWLAIALTIKHFWPLHRLAAALLLPYLAWVSFATALNAELWRLNG